MRQSDEVSGLEHASAGGWHVLHTTGTGEDDCW